MIWRILKLLSKNGVDYPVIYLFLYKLLKESADRHIFVSHRNLLEIFTRRFNKVPKVIHYEIIKELEELKLIKKIGFTNSIRYELIGKDIDNLLGKLNFFP